MKKFLLALALLLSFILPAKADVMPYYVNSINSSSIGVYQPPNTIRIYKAPNDKSQLLFSAFWNANGLECPDISASNLFVVFLPQKDLAFLQIVDESDDGNWLQVLYDKSTQRTGWIKKENDSNFLYWKDFYTFYGHKYGLYYFKDAPEQTKAIYGSTDDTPQVISRITMPLVLKVTSIRGNWALINTYDEVYQQTKIGWIQWRNINGNIYLFPDIK